MEDRLVGMFILAVCAFVISVFIICGTWYAVTVRKQKQTEEARRRKQRDAHNERMFENESLGLYEDERQRRIAAETKLGIVQTQLTRSGKENDRLKTIVAFYEDELRRYRNV